MVSKITAITPADKLKRRQKVFLDGRFAFSLAAEVVARAALKVGQVLDSERVTALAGQERLNRSVGRARRYFGYRPQSEAELKEKLGRRGVPASEIETITAQLKAEGLLDDGDFARFWKENRESFGPRSRRLVCLELKRKGVPQDIIERVAGEISDTESAYRAAQGRVRCLSLTDYQIFYRRLGSYLKRRGFDDEVINHTLSRIWQEMGGDPVNCNLPQRTGIPKGGYK